MNHKNGIMDFIAEQNFYIDLLWGDCDKAKSNREANRIVNCIVDAQRALEDYLKIGKEAVA